MSKNGGSNIPNGSTRKVILLTLLNSILNNLNIHDVNIAIEINKIEHLERKSLFHIFHRKKLDHYKNHEFLCISLK